MDAGANSCLVWTKDIRSLEDHWGVIIVYNKYYLLSKFLAAARWHFYIAYGSLVGSIDFLLGGLSQLVISTNPCLSHEVRPFGRGSHNPILRGRSTDPPLLGDRPPSGKSHLADLFGCNIQHPRWIPSQLCSLAGMFFKQIIHKILPFLLLYHSFCSQNEIMFLSLHCFSAWEVCAESATLW